MFRHLATTSWTEFFPRYKVEFMMKPSHFKSNNAQSFGDYLLVFSKRIQTNSLFTCKFQNTYASGIGTLNAQKHHIHFSAAAFPSHQYPRQHIPMNQSDNCP